MTNKRTTKTFEHKTKSLSDLLLAAKGPHRTGVEFCKECDISAPTFSRFVNMHNKRPCPIDMLQKVAEHADPKSNVSFEQLLAANNEFISNENFSLPEITLQSFLGALSLALVNGKYKIQSTENVTPINIIGLTYAPSYSIYTDAINGQSMQKWDFFFWRQLADANTDAKRFIRQLLMMLGALYIGRITCDKLTFVFSYIPLYKAVIEHVKDLKTDFRISLILMDTEKQIITEEYNIASSAYNAPPKTLFTDTPFTQHC